MSSTQTSTETGTPTGTESLNTTNLSGERADLLDSLAKSRFFLKFTTRDLTDEQAAQRTTVSALCVGGAIKHVTQTERQWTQFILVGPSAMASDESAIGAYLDGFRMLEGETLAGLLADYDQVLIALRNLLENALLYSPAEAPVEMITESATSRTSRVVRSGQWSVR